MLATNVPPPPPVQTGLCVLLVRTLAITLLGGPTPARFSVQTHMDVYSAFPRSPVSVKPLLHTGLTAHHALVRTAGNSFSYEPVPARLGAMTLYLRSATCAERAQSERCMCTGLRRWEGGGCLQDDVVLDRAATCEQRRLPLQRNGTVSDLRGVDSNGRLLSTIGPHRSRQLYTRPQVSGSAPGSASRGTNL